MVKSPESRFGSDIEIESYFDLASESETVVSPKHPEHNDDRVLGAVAAERISLSTDPGFRQADLETIRSWGERERAAAGRLAELDIHGVMDGISGRDGSGSGTLASRIASGAIAERLSALPENADAALTAAALTAALEGAHRAVIDYRGERGDLEEMATTADIVRMVKAPEGGYDLVYAHAGDGRIYVLDGETGRLERLTEDESPALEALRMGLISREQHDLAVAAEDPDSLPDFSNPNFPKAPKDLLRILSRKRQGVSNSVGQGQGLRVTTGQRRLKGGDTVLISSDGVHDNLNDGQIAEMLRRKASSKEIAQAALEAKIKQDDISLVRIEVGGEDGMEEFVLDDDDLIEVSVDPVLERQRLDAAAADRKALERARRDLSA